MKSLHIDFPPRTRSATWRESYEAVLIGEAHVVIWRHDGQRHSEVVATLEGRHELELLARKILRRVAIARRRDERRRPLQLVKGGTRS